MSRPRDRYADVGRAMRAAIERAVAIRLTQRETRAFLAALSLTAGQSVFANSTSVGQLAGLAGLSVKRASEALNALHRYGVVTWTPTRTRGDSIIDLRAELRMDAETAAADRRRRRGLRWGEIRF